MSDRATARKPAAGLAQRSIGAQGGTPSASAFDGSKCTNQGARRTRKRCSAVATIMLPSRVEIHDGRPIRQPGGPMVSRGQSRDPGGVSPMDVEHETWKLKVMLIVIV